MSVVIHNPYEGLRDGEWLRGNLHTHTTMSDGHRPPQEVVDDYASRGYDFLGFSDHDVHADYLDTLDSHGMLLISGNEITAGGPHMIHTDSDRRIEPHVDRQRVIDEVAATHGFVFFAHPNWRSMARELCSIDTLRDCHGYLGLEVFNGVIRRLDGSPYAMDKWDILLSEGKRLWGFANDDSHRPDGDVELGWNVAYAPARDVASVVEALRAGRCYASTGVHIADITVDGDRICVETTDADRIAAVQDWGKRFALADSKVLEVTVPDEATYVRFECFGGHESMAWTQPFFIERG